MAGVRPNSPMAITERCVEEPSFVQVVDQRDQCAVERRGQAVAMALIVVAVRIPGVPA